MVNLERLGLVKGVAFDSSSYNFSLAENRPPGALLGTVRASAGSGVYRVTYSLQTHGELFSVDADGAVRTRTPLDRERQQWYFLDVEAVDTRTPPTSATAAVGSFSPLHSVATIQDKGLNSAPSGSSQVRVLVEDVNEPPQFPPEGYEASVFSIAPFRSPVVHVQVKAETTNGCFSASVPPTPPSRLQASDPDAGDQLLYSLSADSPHFDVDPSSGLVSVVSAAGLAGQTTVVQVRASDPQGLYATTEVEVSSESGMNQSCHM